MFDVRPHQLVAFAAGDDKWGRTPLVVQTAIKLAEAGERVVVIDEHSGARRAMNKLGVDIPGDLWESLAGKTPLQRLLVPITRNLWAVAADTLATRVEGDTPALRANIDRLVEPLLGGAEFVLIDSRLHARGGLSLLSAMAQHMVVVVGAETGSITEAYALIKRLATERGREGFQIVITRAKSRRVGETVFNNLRNTAQDHLGVRLDLLAIVALPTVENLAEELFSRLPHPLGELR